MPLVEKKVEVERNQDEDPGPSNSGQSRPSCSKGQVSTSSVSDIENGPGPEPGSTHLLEEVLHHILGFVTFAEVKSARLVNKHWRQVATISLRRSSTQIKVDRRVSECITKMGDGQFPVNRLEVSPRFKRDCDGKAKICLDSFPRICDWVKELTLSVRIDKRSTVWTTEISPFPTDCVYKDLTYFNLKLIQRRGFDLKSWNRFTDFVRSILEQSPNLREVNIGYKCRETWAVRAERLVLCPVIENIFPIANSVGTSKLSYINFENVPLEKFDLAKWTTLNLKLRKLGLTMSRLSKTNQLLAKFLGTQTGTLKELTLNLSLWYYGVSAGTFTFPRLEKLERLRVICDDSYALVTFAGIDYVRLFPCLKKLDLKENRTNWRDFLGNDLLEPTNTVEELSFPCDLLDVDDDANLNPNTAVIAAKVFTGLKKLEMDADPVLIKAVYENMPNLEVLTFSISFEELDDVITGLEFEVCSRFRGVMTNEWIEELQNAEGRSMHRLQNLTTLKLSNCGYNDRLCMSRLSLHVFKKMRSLKCLDIFNGCADTAERYSADEDRKQFLEELRANFVVL